jgi:hypothetical protein
MPTFTETLISRSKQQHEMTELMLKLRVDNQRFDAIETLGCTNEKDALRESTRHLTKAIGKEIAETLRELETIKGKQYTGTLPFARIPETLQQGGITKAGISDWLTLCLPYVRGNDQARGLIQIFRENVAFHGSGHYIAQLMKTH